MFADVHRIGVVGVLSFAVSCGGSTGLGATSEDAGTALDSSTQGDATSEGSDAIGGGITNDGSGVDDATILSFFDDGSNVPLDGPPPSGFFPDAACGPANCPKGCCNGDGFCVDPPTAQFCGAQGKVCISCGQGQCVGGGAVGTMCDRAQPDCGPSNCAGCCVGSGAIASCQTGTFSLMCGQGGLACTVCGPGEQCRPLIYDAGGYCQANGACNPTTCTGCCVGDICAQGNQSAACGWGGAACSVCGTGSACYSGVCVCGGPLAPGANCGGDAGGD
jgi:hypothetical protein